MRGHATGNPRSFGLSVGGVLCLVAGLLVWRGHVMRAEVVAALGAALVVLGAAWPSILTRPAAAWWRFAGVLGYINTRVLLTVLFAVILTPVGILWRLLGKDPLSRRRASWTGWSPYPERYRNRRHYERMF